MTTNDENREELAITEAMLAAAREELARQDYIIEKALAALEEARGSVDEATIALRGAIQQCSR